MSRGFFPVLIEKHEDHVNSFTKLILLNMLFFLSLFLELKLGLIAESCLNPGFSTMIANIFAMRSDSEVSK